MSNVGGNGPLILTVGSVLAALGIICIGLRAVVASHINGKWRWDFIWVTACGVSGLAATAAIFAAVTFGLGNDVKDVKSVDDLFQIIHWSYIAIFLALGATTFAKWSMIALMLQVQGPMAHKKNIVLWVIGGFNLVVNVLQVIFSATQCVPAEKLWYQYLPGSCPRQNLAQQFSVFQGSMSAFTDVVLALWPISIVYKLQTTMRVKVMFCGLMGLGLIPAVASILRTSKVEVINSSPDVTRTYGPFMLWIAIELWVIVILTSVPVLRPLFLKVFYGIKSTKMSRSTTMRPGTSGTKSGRTRVTPLDSQSVELDNVNSFDDDDTTGIFVSTSYKVTSGD